MSGLTYPVGGPTVGPLPFSSSVSKSVLGSYVAELPTVQVAAGPLGPQLVRALPRFLPPSMRPHRAAELVRVGDTKGSVQKATIYFLLDDRERTLLVAKHFNPERNNPLGDIRHNEAVREVGSLQQLRGLRLQYSRHVEPRVLIALVEPDGRKSLVLVTDFASGTPLDDRYRMVARNGLGEAFLEDDHRLLGRAMGELHRRTLCRNEAGLRERIDELMGEVEDTYLPLLREHWALLGPVLKSLDVDLDFGPEHLSAWVRLQAARARLVPGMASWRLGDVSSGNAFFDYRRTPKLIDCSDSFLSRNGQGVPWSSPSEDLMKMLMVNGLYAVRCGMAPYDVAIHRHATSTAYREIAGNLGLGQIEQGAFMSSVVATDMLTWAVTRYPDQPVDLEWMQGLESGLPQALRTPLRASIRRAPRRRVRQS